MIAYKISHAASSLPDEPEFGRNLSAHSHIDEYEQYRGRKIVAFRELESYKKQRRTKAVKRRAKEKP